MRKCSKCGEEKALEDFYAQKSCKDGRRPDCKDCTRTRVTTRRANNLDAVRDYEQRRYERDREKRKAAARANYYANREARIKQHREYYLANRDKYAAWSAKQKAIRRSVEWEPYTRTEIYERDGGRCKLCGIELPPDNFQIDHIVPIHLRGPDIPANVQLACRPCNRRKSSTLEGQIYFAA